MVITAVAPQPKTFSQKPLTPVPMIARLLPTSMTSSISGGARSPLMMAERNSMRTALTLRVSSTAPATMAPRVAQLVLGGPAPRGHRAAPLRTLLLDLLRGLPEEEVRRDRRAEDSHQRRQGARVRRQARQQRVAQRRRPARTRENGGEDIG